VELNAVEILPECQPGQFAGQDLQNLYIITPSPKLEVGKTYIVNWNGVEYTCVGQDGNAVNDYILGHPDVVFGDIYTFTDGAVGTAATGEPFMLLNGLSADTTIILIRSSVNEPPTLSIRVRESETVHKLDPKFLPDNIGGGADWNAKEGEPGHVLNRTHWTQQGVVEILPETTVTISEDGQASLQLNTPAIIGETYTINWNGTAYTCVAQDLSELEAGTIGIGDFTNFGGSGNGEPFTFVCASTMGIIFPLDGSTSVIISIYCEGENVHKLDAKFLPPEAFNVLVVAPSRIADDGTLYATHTGGEITREVNAFNKAAIFTFEQRTYSLVRANIADGTAEFNVFVFEHNNAISVYSATIANDGAITTEGSIIQLP
jgi:hypothetical protein